MLGTGRGRGTGPPRFTIVAVGECTPATIATAAAIAKGGEDKAGEDL
jgi:hypothetical protein